MLFWGSGASVWTIYHHQNHHYNYQMGIIIMILLTHWFTGSNILLYWFHYLTHIAYIITDLLTWLANWLDWLKDINNIPDITGIPCWPLQLYDWLTLHNNTTEIANLLLHLTILFYWYHLYITKLLKLLILQLLIIC